MEVKLAEAECRIEEESKTENQMKDGSMVKEDLKVIRVKEYRWAYNERMEWIKIIEKVKV